MIYIIGYILCVIIAFWLFCVNWIRDFDSITVEQALFFGIMSATGPVGFSVALIITLIEVSSRSKIMKKQIWPR